MTFPLASTVIERLRQVFLAPTTDDRDSRQRLTDGGRSPNPPTPYLPPEERVLLVLDEGDGSVWQGDIVDETGWSDAKTSRVLCDMEAEGVILRRRAGRRKAGFLPNEVPQHLSPRQTPVPA